MCFITGSPDTSMSTVLWAKTQQLQEDAFRQLQNIYGEYLNGFFNLGSI